MRGKILSLQRWGGRKHGRDTLLEKNIMTGGCKLIRKKGVMIPSVRLVIWEQSRWGVTRQTWYGNHTPSWKGAGQSRASRSWQLQNYGLGREETKYSLIRAFTTWVTESLIMTFTEIKRKKRTKTKKEVLIFKKKIFSLGQRKL